MGSSVSLKQWQLLSPSEQEAVLGLSVTSQQVEFAGTVERSSGRPSACHPGRETLWSMLRLAAPGHHAAVRRAAKTPDL